MIDETGLRFKQAEQRVLPVALLLLMICSLNLELPKYKDVHPNPEVFVYLIGDSQVS